jgi:DNA-binding NtrC family response regulator
MATILLINHEAHTREIFQVALEEAGYRVLTAENENHGLRLLEIQEVDLILVDLVMPDMEGLDLIPLLRKLRPAIKMIAIADGSGEWDYLDAARVLGAHATLKKRFSVQELLDAVAGQLKPSHP